MSSLSDVCSTICALIVLGLVGTIGASCFMGYTVARSRLTAGLAGTGCVMLFVGGASFVVLPLGALAVFAAITVRKVLDNVNARKILNEQMAAYNRDPKLSDHDRAVIDKTLQALQKLPLYEASLEERQKYFGKSNQEGQ